MSNDDDNVVINWEVPVNEGGGHIELDKYIVQVEKEDGEWISNDPLICDGRKRDWLGKLIMSCEVRFITISGRSLKLYGELLNVRI